MFDWLHDSLESGTRLPTEQLLLRLAAALILGGASAAIHWFTGRDRQSTALLSTLVLLSILIALVTVVIGKNAARAFSLVGVLGIVRFRTVVEDTRDTAFVVAAVALGMASGAGYILEALTALPFIVLAAWLFRPGPKIVQESEHRLVVRLGAAPGIEQRVQSLLTNRLPGCRLVGLATARGGAALDLIYSIRPLTGEDALALVAELNHIEGVQGVELKGG